MTEPRVVRRQFLIAGLIVLLAAMTVRARQWLTPDPERLLDAARKAARDGDRAGAITQLDALLADDPTYANALLARGQLALDAGERDHAFEFWRRVPNVPGATPLLARRFEAKLLGSARTRPPPIHGNW
jgi:hypothetical protein